MLFRLPSNIVFVLIFSSLLSFSSMAQNLVPNGDFERNKHWFGFRTLGKLSYWKKANRTTPDYLFGKVHEMGNQEPHSGNHYVGIGTNVVEGHTQEVYVEYIQIRLLKPLIKGNYYCLSMYASRAENRRYALGSLEFNIAKRRPTDSSKKRVLAVETISTFNSKDTILVGSKEWTLLCFFYKANGNERYLTIGTFDPYFKLVKVEHKKNKVPDYLTAYYYIDDVSLIEVDDSLACDCAYKKVHNEDTSLIVLSDTMKQGQSMILENIYFETNKAILDSSSYETLNRLIDMMNQRVNLEIELSGHTDNTGNEQENIRLSEARAKSIVDYLIANGISAERLTYKGYGSLVPVTKNDSEENRKKNRRVELKIIKD